MHTHVQKCIHAQCQNTAQMCLHTGQNHVQKSYMLYIHTVQQYVVSTYVCKYVMFEHSLAVAHCSLMLLLWLQVEAEVLQALHCLPEDVFDHTPGHPHSLSGSSHQRTVDCGITPISHSCVHVNRVPGSIQV